MVKYCQNFIYFGMLFAEVKDNQVPIRTTIKKAKVDSGRGYNKDLFMKEEKIIKL